MAAFFSVWNGASPTCGNPGSVAPTTVTAGTLRRLQELRDRRLVVRQHLEVDEAVDALVQERLDVADGDRPVEVVDGLHDLRAADALGGVDEPVRQADRKGLGVGEDVVADLVARLLAERLRRVRQILLRRHARVRSAGSRRRDRTARRQRHGEHGQRRDRHHSEPQSLSSVFGHVAHLSSFVSLDNAISDVTYPAPAVSDDRPYGEGRMNGRARLESSDRHSRRPETSGRGRCWPSAVRGDRLPAGKRCSRAELLLDTEQLVVLGEALGLSERADLDLACGGADGKVGEEVVARSLPSAPRRPARTGRPGRAESRPGSRSASRSGSSSRGRSSRLPCRCRAEARAAFVAKRSSPRIWTRCSEALGQHRAQPSQSSSASPSSIERIG